jgi:zinc transporter
MSGFAFAVDGRTARELPLAEARAATAELVWIHLCVNDDEAKAWLREAGLADYVIDALTAAETRPRCIAMGDGALLNLRGLSSDEDNDELASVRLYAYANTAYSVTRRPLDALEVVKAEVAGGKIADPGDLIAAFAAAITEGLDPVVAELGDTLDDCETMLDSHGAFELRRKVNHVRIQAIGYRRFLFPQRAALEKLAALPAEWLQDDDRLHLSAAADRAARMAEEVESIRERAGLTHEALTDLRSELIDQRGLIIAIAAMIFLPLTFLTGLYGMNVEGLPYAHQPWAFDAIAGICVVTALAIMGYFSWQHWTR